MAALAPAPTGDLEVLSPELVLIDPELARRARSAELPPAASYGGLPISPLLVLLPDSQRSAGDERDPRGDQARRGLELRTDGRRARVRVTVAAVAVVAVGALLALATRPLSTTEAPVVATSAPVRTPANGPGHALRARPAATTKIPATKASATQALTKKALAKKALAKKALTKKSSTTNASTRKAPRATQRLAWAPVDGATSYVVELFRGSRKVFAGTAAGPVLEVPRRGTSADGSHYELRPGEYRWYVWAVSEAGRAPSAVVQAKLVVTA